MTVVMTAWTTSNAACTTELRVGHTAFHIDPITVNAPVIACWMYGIAVAIIACVSVSIGPTVADMFATRDDTIAPIC